MLTTRSSIIPTILLIILIVLFHTELVVIGARIYAAVVESPRAERLLADYYQHAATRDLEYASNFYQSSLAKYKVDLNKVTAEHKGEIQLAIGQFYECGRGVKVADLNQAKTWYSDAAQSSHPETAAAAKEAATRVSDALKAGTLPSCPYPMDVQFLVKTLMR